MSVLAKIFSVNTYTQFFKHALPRTYHEANSLSERFNGIAKRSFENGLIANINENDNEGLFNIRLTVNAGSQQDPIDKNGVAHFLEHMIFDQNEQTHNQIQRALTKKGLVFSGRTNEFHTVYDFSIPYNKNNVDALLNEIIPSIFNPQLDREQVEYEKNVIENELNMTSDNALSSPIAHERNLAICLLYGDELGSEKILGSSHGIKAIELEDLEGFHSRYYVPNNTSIEVSTPPNSKAFVFSKLKETAGMLAPKQIEPAEKANIEPGQYSLSLDREDLKQTHYGIHFAIPECDHVSDSKNLEILGRYIALKAKQNLRGHKDRMIYHVDSMVNFHQGEYFLSFMGNIKPENANLIMPLVAEIINETVNGNIDEELLEQAKAQDKTTAAIRRFHRQANRYDFESPFSKFVEKHEKSAKTDDVKPSDIQRLISTGMGVPPRLITMGNAENMQSYDDWVKTLPLEDAAVEELEQFLHKTPISEARYGEHIPHI